MSILRRHAAAVVVECSCGARKLVEGGGTGPVDLWVACPNCVGSWMVPVGQRPFDWKRDGDGSDVAP